MLGELYCEVKQLKVLHLPKKNTRYLEKIKVSPASCTAAADFDKFKRSRLMPCLQRPGPRGRSTIRLSSRIKAISHSGFSIKCDLSCIAQDSHGQSLAFHTAIPYCSRDSPFAASPSTSRWLQSVSRHAQVISAMTEHQSASCVIA